MRRTITVLAAIFLLSGLIIVRPQARPGQTGGPGSTRPADMIVVMAPRVAGGLGAPAFPDGSRMVRLSPDRAASPVILTREFFAAAGPQLSFDGMRVLFAAQKTPGSFWQIWEMSIDGSAKRQITACQADCFRPAYLPVGDIAYTVASGHEGRRTSALAVAAIDGSQERIISSGPGNFQLETVLADGRLLVSAASPLLPDAAAHARSLYGVRPDGTGLELLRANLVPEIMAEDAGEMEDGSLVFIAASSSAATGGPAAILRPGAAHAVALGSPANICRSPRQYSKNEWMIACAGTEHAGEPGKFDVYLMDSSSGKLSAPIASDPRQSILQAISLAPQRRPRILWSILKGNAKAGYFVALDSSRSADFTGGRVPGRIERIRVFSLQAADGREFLLGDAPVEQDGSFYIAVPADQPVRFELIGERGNILAEQKSWIWSRPGEQRACLGCHEDKAIAPENHWPLALKRFDSPVQLGVKDVAPVAPE